MIRLAVRVRREQAELVLAELLELVPDGVEEVAAGADMVEYGVYGAPGELPALPDLQAAAGDALVEISTAEVDDDWAERWRAHHRPAVIAGTLTVRPPWEPPGSTPLDVVIDPGQAFGTGAHATTRLCLELLLTIPADGPFLDLGCGSAVLAIVAARLGFAPVVAVDNDPAAAVTARANAADNGVDVEVRRLDLRSQPVPAVCTVAANLLASLLERWAADLAAAKILPRRIIAGGLLAHEADSIAAAFAESGLRERQRRELAGWGALLLESPSTAAREDRELGLS